MSHQLKVSTSEVVAGPSTSAGFTEPSSELPSPPCPVEFICPMCELVFSNPQVTPCCGLDVCKDCAIDKLVDGLMRDGNKTKKCWECGQEILIKDLIDSHRMRERVAIWKRENPSFAICNRADLDLVEVKSEPVEMFKPDEDQDAQGEMEEEEDELPQSSKCIEATKAFLKGVIAALSSSEQVPLAKDVSSTTAVKCEPETASTLASATVKEEAVGADLDEEDEKAENILLPDADESSFLEMKERIDQSKQKRKGEKQAESTTSSNKRRKLKSAEMEVIVIDSDNEYEYTWHGAEGKGGLQTAASTIKSENCSEHEIMLIEDSEEEGEEQEQSIRSRRTTRKGPRL